MTTYIDDSIFNYETDNNLPTTVHIADDKDVAAVAEEIIIKHIKAFKKLSEQPCVDEVLL